MSWSRRSLPTRPPRAGVAALGRRLLALVTALSLLAPSVAAAGTPYSLLWRNTEDPASCEEAALAHDGDAFFTVNQTPLPTFQSEGAFVTYGDGSHGNTAEAEFDSVLLRMGENDFRFGVENSAQQDWCVHAHEVVSLVSAPLGLNKPLFDVRRDGQKFLGETTLGLSLAEINPPLAHDIALLDEALAALREALFGNASKVADLARQESLLQELDTELHDLVKRPLDEIARVDLDAILDRYKDVVDPDTRAALEQVLDDLKQSVTDLHDELGRLIDEFGAQADAAADFAIHEARDAGWNPDDPRNYALGEGDVPAVEVPDIADVPGAFTPGSDPYAAYADAVIASLEDDVRDGTVVLRADFVAGVRAWRRNDAALGRALAERAGVSLAETNAFLDAQRRVTAYVRRFMDASDWLEDTPVPAAVRASVEGELQRAFGDLADEMKDNLNLWPPGDGVSPEAAQLCDVIDAFAGGISALGEGAQRFGDVMGTLTHATSRVAIGFVPYVGPALDLCECVTGKAWCLPSGRELSTEERIFSGVGFAAAGGPRLWRSMRTSGGLRPAAMRVAGELEEIEAAFAEILLQNRRTTYKTLTGAVTTKGVNAFEKKAAKFLVDDGRSVLGVGDDGVRTMLGIPAESRPGTYDGAAPDFVSISSGNKIVLSEAKGGTVEVRKVQDQLSNATIALKKRGLDGDVARVELFMEQGAKFKPTKFTVKDGYLFDSDRGKTVTLDGFNKFILVIRL